MAVSAPINIGGITYYTCLSTDIKPNANPSSICQETDGNKNTFEMIGGAWVQTRVGGALRSYETAQIGGERNTDSSTNNYTVTHGESNYSVIDEADGVDIQVSSGAAAFLEGIYINETLAGATIILQDDTTPVITLPAGLAAGAYLTFPSVRFETDLTCNCEAGLTTGNITLMWRAI